MSREEQAPSRAGLQRSGSRAARTDVGAARRGQGQPSLLPAMMANPDLMATAFMANPFAFAQAMGQEMDRLFSSLDLGARQSRVGWPAVESDDDQALQRGDARGRRAIARWAPAVEILQREHELVVRADLPGLTPDDVQVDVEDGVLTVSGERRESIEDRDEGYVRSERGYGAFARSLALPEGVDEEQVRAGFEHGVLEVTVPLPEPRQPRGRRVRIEGGAPRSGEQRAMPSRSQESQPNASPSGRAQQARAKSGEKERG